ncbi:hypothetical protein SLEP1_g27467 [Rubroshorea leprosula]|uniref:Uncharacterized protein n=1 Tax=Rubroshorea leprosula TaxID=152421 RepID=A0AAV5JZT2_9ROSI|nr:hypothetical protein SLEP1_g27467 [Rubroshorea leprosula]
MMRHTTNITAVSSAAVGNEFHNWNTPTPYLFGWLAFMLVLIATALVILVCSCKKAPPPNKKDAPKRAHMPLEMEPKIVVIMAGDELPRYLANPAGCVSSTSHADQF